MALIPWLKMPIDKCEEILGFVAFSEIECLIQNHDWQHNVSRDSEDFELHGGAGRQKRKFLITRGKDAKAERTSQQPRDQPEPQRRFTSCPKGHGGHPLSLVFSLWLIALWLYYYLISSQMSIY